MLAPIAVDAFGAAYARFPQNPDPRYTAFLAATGTFVALVSVAAALCTFGYNAYAARRAQRKQQTMTLLLESRLSSEFRGILEKRRHLFPEYTDVSFDAWNAARTAAPEDATDPDQIAAAERSRESALAVTQLLNYYEFLAVGIKQGDLDKDLLRKTLRSIMCNLVDDCRDLIAEMRRRKPSTYEHLCALYDDWRAMDAKDINGNPNERPIPKLPPI
ncbi:DUF4760 domain-containing protein [Sulfitobacter albidus]|uniref:DUF4760 domain-containing protein n=1 Tax=Sulfitobacter albidus TaxID=2829501 RepID=A0A975JFL7_9RHOB|nr:DUF4760 domain-containing protein [Sulfitobacter albidus]QUJ77365.1 DUF4760 domain-containing protein [Sulfitobacter albidus]